MQCGESIKANDCGVTTRSRCSSTGFPPSSTRSTQPAPELQCKKRNEDRKPQKKRSVSNLSDQSFRN